MLLAVTKTDGDHNVRARQTQTEKKTMVFVDILATDVGIV